jgi:hypothetical protein
MKIVNKILRKMDKQANEDIVVRKGEEKGIEDGRKACYEHLMCPSIDREECCLNTLAPLPLFTCNLI